MLLTEGLPEYSDLRQDMMKLYRSDEAERIQELLAIAENTDGINKKIADIARELVIAVRENGGGKGLDAFMQQYDLSSDEGIALMCLSEAMLRVPDDATVDKLIKDKISKGDWGAHSGKSESLFVNAATWGLMLTGKFVAPNSGDFLGKTLSKFIGKSSEPVIRKAVHQAMKILGQQFVMGRNIDAALKRAQEKDHRQFLFSYDMLGEAARTQADADRYMENYLMAIEAIGKYCHSRKPEENPGISIKLSALFPRYELSQRERAVPELTQLLLKLVLRAKKYNMGLTVDAEEANRLNLSLDIIKNVFIDSQLENYNGFGLAVQSYQKRAPKVIDWLADLSKKTNRRIMLRLIKGAYWDSEIKESQMWGYHDYPVFTRKANTDVSFLACVKKVLGYGNVFYPQFATHNAHSIASVLVHAENKSQFEFQCLHGMGESLYENIIEKYNLPVRVYAPVGEHEDLLAYLVRRLLENGANTSFVNRIHDASEDIDSVIADPIHTVKRYSKISHPKIPLPKFIYGNNRINSKGFDLTDGLELKELNDFLEKAYIKGFDDLRQEPINNKKEVNRLISNAETAYFNWTNTSVHQRAACLLKAADLFEQHMETLMAIAIKEAGKTIPDAVAEVREAVDFCRYYAMQAQEHLVPQDLPGPTGEFNQLQFAGRGPIVCISPWNFPLAIFTGQVVAALVAGNCVLAKPAEQTGLIAAKAVELLHQAGIPKDVLQLVPGKGSVVGAAMVEDVRTKGVIFTGSTETAQFIQQSLIDRGGPIVPLIAETGGQNAMIVDSTALPEQVVMDVLSSGFGSAGQRCSALRVLFIQTDIAEKLLVMLKGAMDELVIGDPSLLSTDIGPVIDMNAYAGLKKHCDKFKKKSKDFYQLAIPKNCPQGSYFPPTLIEIDNLAQLEREVFGPVVHVIKFKSSELDKIISDINNTGYGLTLGIHSRIDETAEYIQKRVRVGNVYVNRNMIGAVVGVQPFGGEGLSGTGPKAGGPHYLSRLITERTLTINTAAAGGNASLLSLTED